MRNEFGLKLHIAHFNHNLRKNSKKDEVFVEKISKKLGLPITIGKWNNPNLKEKSSLEELARDKRFAFFLELAKKVKADSVALAHNKDDLAETIMMRILRGTGLHGFRGILPKRKINDAIFVRPLLNTTRKQIQSYLEQNNLTFRIDETNEQLNFFRNRIRHELLPFIEKNYNKGIKETLANLANNITIDYEFIKEESDKIFSKIAKKKRKKIEISLGSIKKISPSIRRMLFRKCLNELKGNTTSITLTHIQLIDDLIINKPFGTYLHLPHKISVSKDKKKLVLSISNT